MNWDELSELIPDRLRGDSGIPLLSQVTELPSTEAWQLAVAQPGVHWDRTDPQGGDYRIDLTIAGDQHWSRRAFTHEDLFVDVFEKKREDYAFMASQFAPALVEVVAEGRDPFDLFDAIRAPHLPGLPTEALLAASQCLALCEHRRYKGLEPTGGRCLPARFAASPPVPPWQELLIQTSTT